MTATLRWLGWTIPQALCVNGVQLSRRATFRQEGGKVYSLVQRNPSSVYHFDSRDTLVSFMARNIPPIIDKFATMYELDSNDWIIRGSFFRRPNKASGITN